MTINLAMNLDLGPSGDGHKPKNPSYQKGLEAPLHQLAHQLAAPLLEAGQFVGLKPAHGQTGQFIEMAAQSAGELLAGGANG